MQSVYCQPRKFGRVQKTPGVWYFILPQCGAVQGFSGPSRVAQSVGHLTRKSGPGFNTRSGNILSLLLPLFQEGQLSVTGKSMCVKYWLTA